MHAVDHLPHSARRRRHVDVAHAGAAVERVDDGVYDRGQRADGPGLIATPHRYSVAIDPQPTSLAQFSVSTKSLVKFSDWPLTAM
jgi:hypothetical protein